MINILGKLPRKLAVAYSGGVDSAAVLHFLNNNHEVTLLHFNHGETDPGSYEATQAAYMAANHYGIKIELGFNENQIGKGQSVEEFWRDSRYEWLHSLDHHPVVVVAHHLDDAVETWVWSSLHGNPRTIPYKRNNNVYRPFLTTCKVSLEQYALRHEVAYCNDPTNLDLTKQRNYIRKNLLPHCYKINPGLHKVVKNKIIETEKNLLTPDAESYILRS